MVALRCTVTTCVDTKVVAKFKKQCSIVSNYMGMQPKFIRLPNGSSAAIYASMEIVQDPKKHVYIRHQTRVFKTLVHETKPNARRIVLRHLDDRVVMKAVEDLCKVRHVKCELYN